MADRLRVWCVLIAVLSTGSVTVAQLDDEDFPPGLLARYTSADRTIERVDRAIAFEWNASPDQRMVAGSFEVEWTGQVLVREPGEYRLHAFVHGECAVSVDGVDLLRGTRETPGWLATDELSFEFGERSLRIQFRTASLPAQIKLFWSSAHFGIEPIPFYLLFRDEPNEQLALIEQGRLEFAELRCNRCHERSNDVTSPPAADLTKLRGAVSAGWLEQKIEDPAHDNPHARMPNFGLLKHEAKAIAAALLHDSTSPKTRSRPDEEEEDLEKGEVLLLSSGCAACHQFDEKPVGRRLRGGSLAKVGAKRSLEWLVTWLESPERLNGDHQMPVFQLASRDRRRIALALAARGGPVEPPTFEYDKSLVDAGRTLIRDAGCASCHMLKDRPRTRRANALSTIVTDWNDSCLAAEADRKTLRPAFKNAQTDALRAYIESRFGELQPVSEFERGRLVLEQNNCTACHERGHEPGITSTAGRLARTIEALRGQSEAMIPPSLNAVGDKLRDDALAAAVAGEQKEVRMPWLHIRMPRFRHSPEERQSLLRYLVASDRIPDSPTNVDAEPSDNAIVDGYTLIGPRGLSCVACHKVGEYEPKVALGTRGSDLMMIGKRMRPGYFRRWTRSPIRVVPGMEMPSIRQAVPDLLDEDVNRQLATIWDALNDPKFTAPTDPASVEQFVAVAPGGPARIIRDVFTNPDSSGGGAVARAMAIGLNNGHTAIFDLDTFSLRQWAFGEMARQRTKGKSWYWDAAGLHVATGIDNVSDFALRNMLTNEIIVPRVDEAQSGRLLSYENRGDGAVFESHVHFEIGGELKYIRLMEEILPYEQTESETRLAEQHKHRTGWVRKITAHNVPSGYELLVARQTMNPDLGNPSVEWSLPDPTRRTSPGTPSLNPSSEWVTSPSTVFHHDKLDADFVASPNCLFDAAPDAATDPDGTTLAIRYTAELSQGTGPVKTLPPLQPSGGKVETVPGFSGDRLHLSPSIMPTAMTWRPDGTFVFTSLKGHVYAARDTDGDGIEDSLEVLEEGLAAPFGILADGDDLIVAHKPEVVRLQDRDGDGRVDARIVVASGWGYSDNYHDWTTGLVRDNNGNMYAGLGSDYSQDDRPKDRERYRGSVIQIHSDGTVEPFSMSFRYPVGLAVDNRGRLFATDNQGVQNTFNEINHLVKGRHYGVPSRHEPNPDARAWPPALQVPHPWSRSINSLVFVKDGNTHDQLIDHAIACEYDSHYLARFTFQDVGDSIQGAAYYFSRPNSGMGGKNFVGPICSAIAPNGDIYIGSIYDSGWEGGRNTGAITRLRRNGSLPNGIRELKATPDGFELTFFHQIDAAAAADPASYTIFGYTRHWQGAYATPDSERHRVAVESIVLSDDLRTVRLKVDELRAGFVYEVGCGRIGTDTETALWPATGHYTMTTIPVSD